MTPAISTDQYMGMCFDKQIFRIFVVAVLMVEMFTCCSMLMTMCNKLKMGRYKAYRQGFIILWGGEYPTLVYPVKMHTVKLWCNTHRHVMKWTIDITKKTVYAASMELESILCVSSSIPLVAVLVSKDESSSDDYLLIWYTIESVGKWKCHCDVLRYMFLQAIPK